MSDEIGKESIFIGKSGEERQKKREDLDRWREEKLKKFKKLTDRLKIPKKI